MLGKKKLLAKIGVHSGATRLVEALPGRPSLMILNYHRIGDAMNSPFDSGAYSCTAGEFDWQVGRLKRRFQIVGLDEAVNIVHGRSEPAGVSVLLTFDDGYRDNFETAFPILRAHGVSAAFFLPTSFVGTNRLPWWDSVALVVKRSPKGRIALSYPERTEFDLSPSSRERSIMAILKLFKLPSARDTGRALRELSAACEVQLPAEGGDRTFMSWDEAREMQSAGMGFGSHAHSHDILSKLSYERQLEEARTSRRIVESELGRRIETLAYPDGQPETFNKDTFRALREAGYTTAFSFYSGINVPGNIHPFNVLRGGADDDDRASFRLRIALRAATGRELF